MNIQRWAAANNGAEAFHVSVSDSGYARLGRDWQYEGMCSPYSRLYYIFGGEGEICYRNERVRLLPGNVYLVPAELTFDYGCDSYMEQLYFHVNVLPESGRELFARCEHCLVLPFSDEEGTRLRRHYQGAQLLDLFRVQNQVREEIARFIEISGIAGLSLGTDSAFASVVFSVVRTSLSSSLTLRDVARTLSMSESTLAKRFRAETGMTLGRYIDGLLMQEACRLLVSSTQSIGEIAETLDFCDQFYFCRYFKQRQGETPSQYRKKRAMRI